jgi:hypothetical protein
MGQNVLFDLVRVPSTTFRQNFVQDTIQLILIEPFQVRAESGNAHFIIHPQLTRVKGFGRLRD